MKCPNESQKPHCLSSDPLIPSTDHPSSSLARQAQHHLVMGASIPLLPPHHYPGRGNSLLVVENSQL